jgi:hypothetical protein
MGFILFVLFSICLSFGHGAESDWWQKPSTQKRIREERAVIISIKSKSEDAKNYYHMTGAGVVKATPAHTLKKILSFQELEKVSSYFKKVTHQPEYNRVYFLLEAYGYQARLLIKYEVLKKDDGTVFLWNVVWGGFQGMMGRIELTGLGGDKTQAILISRFEDKEIPLPHIFKGFVLEVIVQHVAKSMRAWIEESVAREGSKG